MSNYVENNLGREEKIVLKAKKSWACLLMPIFVCIIIIAAATVLSIMISDYSQNPYKVKYNKEIKNEINENMAEFDEYSDSLSDEVKQQLIDEEEGVNNWKEYRNKFKEQLTKAIEYKYKEKFDISPTKDEDAQIIKLVFSLGIGVICVIAFFIGILPLIIQILKLYTMDLAITNKRVVGKIGVVSINTLDVPIDKIDHVQIQANFLGRLFHYYSLKVISVGGSGFDNGSRKNKGFIGIANAQEFKNIVTEAIEQHAQDARKAQAEEIARAMGK